MNNNYPKQLIQEILQQLDPSIVDFFDNTKEQYRYPVDSALSLVEYTMENCFKGQTAKEDLRKVYDAHVRSRRKKKGRWLQSLERDLEVLSPLDKDYPFYSLSIQKNVLDASQWKTLYGALTFEDLVQKNLEDARVWQKDAGSFLVCFPAIQAFTANSIFKSLVSDTLVCLYKYIDREYDGAIENYFMSFPKELLGIPLFAPNKNKLALTPGLGDALVERYEYSENILETSTSLANIDINKQLRALDHLDLMFLAVSIQNLDLDFYTTRQSRVRKSDLVKILHAHPGKKHYDAVNERCLKMTKYNFTIRSNDNKKGISFNLIDSVDTTDPDYVVFTYGNMLYGNIIQNELTNIKSSNLHLLELNLSTILYQPLFDQRIILSLSREAADESTDICKDYPYSFFYSSARFPTRSRKKNMDLIGECLEEFVQKGIVISSYERLKTPEGFRIHFYPLSAEELADLSYNRFNWKDEVIDMED